MKYKLTATLAAALYLSVPTLLAAERKAAGDNSPPPPAPQIEVAFVIDTTGSMGGLIQAAKEKVWAIANTLASSKPAPRIKLGLVAYRDRGDTYITKRTDLTDDLDAVYKELMSFRAEGGGDAPESVNQAVNEAVTQLSWSQDAETYRVLFLVGDCPPHMDYANDVKYPESCKLAAKAGLWINCIQCGAQPETERVWRDIAMKAEGRYFRVEQSGGAILAGTPFDADLARLARELDGTRVFYGEAQSLARAREKTRTADAVYEGATVVAQAQRAVFNTSAAGARNFTGDAKELVNDLGHNRAKLSEIKEAELPEELRKLQPAEREAFVKAKQAQRQAIQKQIDELAAKRQAHLVEEMKKVQQKGQSGLDLPLYETIKAQAGRKGIHYEGGPAL
jgi:hypothetical protein